MPNQPIARNKGEIVWKCPSNIALVKYWGKYGEQLPRNPSLSFSLCNSCTTTSLAYKLKDRRSVSQSIEYYYDHKINNDFAARVGKYFEVIRNLLPFTAFFDFTINSVNTFPHSAGIASSASFFGSLALCLVEMEKEVMGSIHTDEEFFMKSSFLARLGSGSAARSVYGGYCVWGQSSYLSGSDNEAAIPFKDSVHEIFKDLNDVVLILDEGKKKVSSSKGHALMQTNPYAEIRFKQAGENLGEMLKALNKGDLEQFIKIVENEALSLHAMMLTSDPGYFLIKPESLSVINDLRDFREQSGIPILFTLDAGPNVHILFPDSVAGQARNFINNKLKKYSPTGKLIEDRIGSGPIRMDV